MDVATIGLDLAKHWFQVHGIDPQERVMIRRKLRRGEVVAFFAALPPCVVGMEACATAHHFVGYARESVATTRPVLSMARPFAAEVPMSNPITTLMIRPPIAQTHREGDR